MIKEKGFVQYVVIIAVILSAVFLSQQAYLRGYGKSLSGVMQGYLAKGSNWAMSKIYPKVSGEVSKRGAIITNEVNQEKEKISENIGDKIKNYFSGVVDNILHPSQTQNNSCISNCQPYQTQPKP